MSKSAWCHLVVSAIMGLSLATDALAKGGCKTAKTAKACKGEMACTWTGKTCVKKKKKAKSKKPQQTEAPPAEEAGDESNVSEDASEEF